MHFLKLASVSGRPIKAGTEVAIGAAEAADSAKWVFLFFRRSDDIATLLN